MTPGQQETGHGTPPLDFTIDGQAFSSTDRAPLASTLLSDLAHVDPTLYDLGEMDGKSPTPKVFDDDEVVHLHPNARYVTLRTGPGPVE